MAQIENLGIDNRTMSAMRALSIDSRTTPEWLGAFLFGQLKLINEHLHRLYSNDIILRSYMAPGDVKLSVKRYDPTTGLNQMPGFVPWEPNLSLLKADYPALYEAWGSAEPEDSDDKLTFTLPDHNSGYIRFAAASETSGNKETVIASGSAVAGIKLFPWIKT